MLIKTYAVYFKFKKFDELEIYLKILIKFNPKDAISNYNLSIAQEKLNKLNEAKVSLEKV